MHLLSADIVYGEKRAGTVKFRNAAKVLNRTVLKRGGVGFDVMSGMGGGSGSDFNRGEM